MSCWSAVESLPMAWMCWPLQLATWPTRMWSVSTSVTLPELFVYSYRFSVAVPWRTTKVQSEPPWSWGGVNAPGCQTMRTMRTLSDSTSSNLVYESVLIGPRSVISM